MISAHMGRMPVSSEVEGAMASEEGDRLAPLASLPAHAEVGVGCRRA